MSGKIYKLPEVSSKQCKLPEVSRQICKLPEVSRDYCKLSKESRKLCLLPEMSTCVCNSLEISSFMLPEVSYKLSETTDSEIDYCLNKYEIDTIDENYSTDKEICFNLEAKCKQEQKVVKNSEIHGLWVNDEIAQSSTWRELEALRRVTITNIDKLSGHTVKYCTDNRNIKYILSSGSNVDILQNLCLKMHDICDKYNILFVVEWIPREENKKADYLSRCSDSDDWSISDRIFEILNDKWGPHDIDRFASNYNNKCKRFNSRWWVPGTEAVDSFTQNWSGDINWVVPPPNIIMKVIKKMESDKCKTTLIIPKWESASFWPHVIQNNGKYKDFVKDVYMLPIVGAVISGRGNNGLFNTEPFSFRMMALKCDFQK